MVDTKAPLASPALTGVPTAPTAAPGTNTIQLATTQFVKTEVDAGIAGLSWKQAARVATTANITLSGLQSIDGYTTVAGDRVLVKNQSTATQNGIYIAAAGAWSRAIDTDTSSELEAAAVYISTGTTQKTTGWVLSNPGTIVLGTTNLAFAQFSGSNLYTFTSPLQLSGNAVSILQSTS